MQIEYYLPEQTVGNGDLVKFYPEWTEEKIFSKTGIVSRHVTSETEDVVDMAEAAARKSFAKVSEKRSLL